MINTTTTSASYIRFDKQAIAAQSIIWLEGDWNYTRIYQQGRPAQMSAYTLKWYQEQLTDFIRVRKDAIVNPQHIRAVLSTPSQPRRLRLLLSNGDEVEVARRRQVFVKRRLQAGTYAKGPLQAAN
nr:LytTR family DNA-binding domain-containing protein [uncultured Arsenicibacter sp.]